MRNWLPWIVGAAAVALVVYAFSQFASDRRKPRDAPDTNGLVGKPAPDFEGDFAINGKPVKLSDLKGKVVLVDFWAVWCTPCILTFPHLRDWDKRYKNDGLEIVGVTMYNFETGRNFGFDKEAGKLTRLDKSDKLTEQQMLRDFANHHKLGHLLMALPKQEINKAFQEYGVDGIPQVVVIDRQGIVRKVGVGADEQTAVAIESEIKRLLVQ